MVLAIAKNGIYCSAGTCCVHFCRPKTILCKFICMILILFIYPLETALHLISVLLLFRKKCIYAFLNETLVYVATGFQVGDMNIGNRCYLSLGNNINYFLNK